MIVSIISLTVFASTAISIVDVVFSSETIAVGDSAPMVLTYKKPASKTIMTQVGESSGRGLGADFNLFQQASLPIGSGDLGGSIFGEIANERIIINEKTLWSGGVSQDENIDNGGNLLGKDANGKLQSDYYYDIRQALLDGDKKLTKSLFKQMRGDTSSKGAYQCFGNVYLNFGHKNVKNYNRNLNIDNAIASVSYNYQDTSFGREFLASNPDNVIAIKLTAVGGQKLNFTVNYPSLQGATVLAKDNYIESKGKVADNGLQFYSVLKVDTVDGQVQPYIDSLQVADCNEATIFLSVATDYNDNYPVYRTGETADELATRVVKTVDNAISKGYEAVKTDHIADYKALYDRMSVNFGAKQPKITTEQLLYRYPTVFLWKSERLYAEQLLFNYGRYLLISSSRENSKLPANLQGVWNGGNNALWGSDYHVNINLQMNYWPAYNTNLAECVTPLVEYVDKLREPGRVTAKTYTATKEELAANLPNEAYGFIANTECNPFGHTSPGEGKYAKALWSPAAVAWLLQNLYEGYEYGCDIDYLTQIYPIMKEAALYFERTMIVDPASGRLVTAPAYSPEHGPISLGNTYEQSLVWQLLTDTSTAAKTLGVDPDKVNLWQDMLSKLNPIEIGKSGQIKEWYNENYVIDLGKPFHRHTSHLLGLFPCDLMDKNVHPEWIDSVETSLNWRGTKSTGWAMGQRINTWARIGDGNKAYKMIKQLFTSGIYPNFFDAHPPFQIDGNFGYTSGVAEMLMQSNLGYIELLPALPSSWSKGEINGIVARGNFLLSFNWDNASLQNATITSNSGNTCVLRFDGASNFKVLDKDGNAISYLKLSGNQISFETEANKTYQICYI
ncbi:MAG: glycoside hydrolase family 95 protein [Clostridia bacterium]